MGAPDSGMQAADQPTADALLAALRTIKPAEREKHEHVLNYWLSIRGDKEFPPLHDLDPLQISEAGPSSILLELIGGGQDAEIRHLGEALTSDVTTLRIIDAPNPSILACIAKKLPIVAISRDFLALEDSFDSADGWTRLWATLLPLSSCGSWVDYVYAFVTVETSAGKAANAPEPEVAEQAVAEVVDEAAVEAPVEVVVAEADVPAEDVVAEADVPAEEAAVEPDVVTAAEEAEEPPAEPAETVAETADDAAEPAEIDEPQESLAEEPAADQPFADEPVAEEPLAEQALAGEPASEEPAGDPAGKSAPGFSKLLEGFANLTGFYGQGVKVDPLEIEPATSDLPAIDPEPVEPSSADPEQALPEPEVSAPVAEQPPEPPVDEVLSESAPPAPAMEGTLQDKLAQVRAKADEAQQARLRAVAALQEGLSAAYDFALDAETSPEEYLRLVEEQGMKIQLRAPMAPVVKLAFGDLADTTTIKECETVLAWALKEELPRGALLDRLGQAGGIPELAAEIRQGA